MEPFQICDADDWLASHRETAKQVLTVLLYIGITFGLVAVVMVVQQLVHSTQYVPWRTYGTALTFIHRPPTNVCMPGLKALDFRRCRSMIVIPISACLLGVSFSF